MSKEISLLSNDMLDILSSVITKAANSELSEEASNFKSIKKRMELATNETVILADYSTSMSTHVGKYEKLASLKIAVRNLFKRMPTNRFIIFGYAAYLTDITSINRATEPSTNLAAGLELACQFKPKRTIVITDGQCNDEKLALEQAEKLTGVIDVIFCGNPSDLKAIEFLKKLARLSGGREITVDMTKDLAIDKGFEQLLLSSSNTTNQAIEL
jgi:hypothetical protein